MEKNYLLGDQAPIGSEKWINMNGLSPLQQKPILYEPKLINRFRVNFSDNIGIEYWKVKSITKPIMSQSNWYDINIVLYDIVGPSTSMEIFKFVENFKKNKTNEVFYFNILALDPVGIVVEEWYIVIDEITLVDYGYFSCEEKEDKTSNNLYGDNVSLINLIIKPKTCILTQKIK